MVVTEVVGERGLGGGDGEGDEGGADDAEHELQLAAAHGGRLRAGVVVLLMLVEAEVGARHPGLDEVGVAEELVGAGGAASRSAEGREHLLGNGHLQHRLQPVLALQIGAQLPHLCSSRSSFFFSLV